MKQKVKSHPSIIKAFAALIVITFNILNVVPVALAQSFTESTGDNTFTSASELTLEDFFNAALEYSPSLKIARETWNIGTARKRATTGQLLPQVTASANINDNRRTQDSLLSTYTGNRYSLQLTQVLFNWQAFSARAEATYNEDRAEAEYYAELAELFTDVAEKYFDVLQAEDAIRSIEAEVGAVSNQLNQIQRAYDLQLAQITDLYAAQARLASVQAEQLDLTSQLALSREALRSISGLPVNQVYQLSADAVIPSVEGNVQEWVNRAQTGNHLILARQLSVQAANKRVAQSHGAYMPRVNLIVQQQNTNIGFENVQVPKSETTYVGIDFTMPIFAGGSNRARVSEAVSQRSIAESELQQIQLDIIERTRTAYLLVKSSELRTQAARLLADSTSTSAMAMQRGFELGTVTSVDVLNAIQDQYQAQRDLQKSRYEHIKARLILLKEAGIISANDLIDVSRLLVAPE